jgi:hypothetical protein
VLVIYYGLKTVLIASIVAAFVRAEPLRQYKIFLALLSTAGVAFLSWVFLLSQLDMVDLRLWGMWLGANFAGMLFFLWLLERLENNFFFWYALPLVLLLIFNEPNLLPVWAEVFGKLKATAPVPR